MGYFAKREYGYCRALIGHAWEIERRALVVDGNAVTLVVACSRCGTSRREKVSLGSGQVRGRVYKYEAEYRLEGDVPRKDTLRKEVVAGLAQGPRGVKKTG